ncbi:hypothetical protein NDU88_007906 [Pleurodeles waltl]|uniref:Uncharacterized protein n=1 Tax=Pleurodeles waltl TaxID=8319 RepID=A0AAV7VR17_PLEWA|nr:hypothetical protein NDU88_007906 [Pleurodeles waltl]
MYGYSPLSKHQVQKTKAVAHLGHSPRYRDHPQQAVAHRELHCHTRDLLQGLQYLSQILQQSATLRSRARKLQTRPYTSDMLPILYH